MLVPSLASCSDTQDIEDTIIPVYTFYGIKGEGTTDEAVRSVELAINRVLMSRYTFAVDFRLFFEDEYEEALDEALEEYEEYQNSGIKTTVSLESGEEDPYAYTEDKIIEMLESGEDFELQVPRVDVLICKDSDHYFRLANEGKLAYIDTTLENEGKILSEYIHPTLFSLAKIGRRTYGVPNNVALGQYEYILFDKEYLDKYKFDYSTMKTMEDLEEYLAIVKEGEKDSGTDVIPLKDVGTPLEYEFLFDDNMSFYIEPFTTDSGIDTGKIYSIYDSNTSYLIDNYAELIAKYRSLGYIDAKDAEHDSFAVTFFKGTPFDIADLEKETGKEYEYVVYKTPTATTASLDTVYSISNGSTNDITTVIDIIVAMFTDSQIKDYFYHGISGEHYIVDDYGYIEPIVNGESGKYEYVMANQYTGNIYLASLKQGETDQTTDFIKELNLSATLSLSSGFSYVPKTITKGDKSITEPNYVEIIEQSLKDSFVGILDGSYGIVDYDEFSASCEEKLREEAIKNTETAFSESLINAHIATKADYFESQEFMDKMLQDATNQFNELMHNTAITVVKNEITSEVKSANPDATDEEINAAIEAGLTDERIQAYIDEKYTAEMIQANIEQTKTNLINIEKNNVTKVFKETSEYIDTLANYLNSEQYAADVEAYIASNGDDYVYSRWLRQINAEITKKATEFHTQAKNALEAEIKKFNEEAKSTLGLTEDEAQSKLDVTSYLEFFENRLESQYYLVYQDPSLA